MVVRRRHRTPCAMPSLPVARSAMARVVARAVVPVAPLAVRKGVVGQPQRKECGAFADAGEGLLPAPAENRVTAPSILATKEGHGGVWELRRTRAKFVSLFPSGF